MKALLGIGAVLVVSVAPAFADPVIVFDDLPNSGAVPAGYHLLNWSGFDSLNGLVYPGNPSGFQAGVVSANIVVVPDNFSTASITGGMFDFLSAYLTAAWNDNLQFEAKGYIHGTLVYDTTNTLSATAPTLIQFNYYGVDEVDFISSGGTHHAGYGSTGTSFAMDNVGVVVYSPYSPGITNGGFETGDFSGWLHLGDTNFDSVQASPSYAHSGTYGAALGPDGAFGNLEQTILGTTAGQRYQLSFWLETFNLGPTNQFIASLGGQTFFNQTNIPASSGYSNLQYTFTATMPRATVEFSYQNDTSFFGLDDVSVTPLPMVTNGGFETGDLSGWTQSGVTLNMNIVNGGLLARSGSFGGEFGAENSPGFISQTLATFPGQPYLVSCWLDSYYTNGPNEFLAEWNGTTLFDQTNLPAFGWTNYHFIATATNQQTKLTFGFRDDPSFLGFDEASVLPVPIVTNGGFETGDFSGWTPSGNFTYTSVVLTNSDYVSSGVYGVAMGPSGSPGFLSQTVSTLPGQSYLLSCWFDTTDGSTPNEFGVSWNGTTLLDFTNWNASGWLNVRYLVQAPSTDGTIQFKFQKDNGYFGLDEVTLQPVLAPKFLSITNSGGKTLLTWSTLPDFTYQLQTSTNLTTWTNIGFSLSASSTNMSTTNVSADPKRFYRLWMQPPFLVE